jgi:WD40 repeat protein
LLFEKRTVSDIARPPAEPAGDMKYWAFVSYSHRDNRKDGNPWGDWLHGALENFKVPPGLAGRQGRYGEAVPDRLFPVFQDEKELPTNADLGDAIHQALVKSRYLVVICSPRSARSLYVDKEILEFKRLGRSNRILAIIVDGEPNADAPGKGVAPDRECFAQALRHPLGPDGNLDLSQFTEPIAADVRLANGAEASLRDRSHQGTLEREKLRIVAGLLGLGFDDLVQRDRERQLREARERTRRNRRLSVLISVLVLVAAAATVYGLMTRSQSAETARKARVQQEQAAQKQAESERELEEQEIKAAADKAAGELAIEGQKKQAAAEKAAGERRLEDQEKAADQAQASRERELGRKAFLAAEPIVAAQHLYAAYRIQEKLASQFGSPPDAATRLLLGTTLARLQGATRVLRGHMDDIGVLKFSPNGKYLVSGDIGNLLNLWRSSDGSLLRQFGQSGNFSADQVTFAPDGKRLLVISGGGADAQVLPVEGGSPAALQFKTPGADRLLFATFLTDGGSIIGSVTHSNGSAGAAPESHMVTWNCTTGTRLYDTTLPEKDGNLVAFSAAGDRVLVLLRGPGFGVPPRQIWSEDLESGRGASPITIGTNDTMTQVQRSNLLMLSEFPPGKPELPARIYSAVTGALVGALPLGEANPGWSPSGKMVFSTDRMGQLHFWDASDPGLQLEPAGPPLAAPAAGGTPDPSDPNGVAAGRRGFSVGFWRPGDQMQFWDASIQIAKAASGKQLPLVRTLSDVGSNAVGGIDPGDTYAVVAGAGGFLADSAGLTSIGVDNIWDLRAGRIMGVVQGRLTRYGDVAFSPDGRQLATILERNLICLWDWRLARVSDRELFGHSNLVQDITWSPDGKKVVTAGQDGSAIVWDSAAGTPLLTLDATREDPKANVTTAQISADGQKILVGLEHGDAELRDAAGGGVLKVLSYDKHGVVELLPDSLKVAMSPRGDRCATFSTSGWGELWNPQTMEPVRNVHVGTNAAAGRVTFSRDGSAFIVLDTRGSVYLLDSATGELKTSLGNGTARLTSAAVSPNGDRVVAEGDQGSLTLWSAAGGTPLSIMKPNATKFTVVQFSPDGNFFAAGDGDGFVHVFRAANGEAMPLLQAERPSNQSILMGSPEVISIDYSPDGQFVASASANTVRVWDAATGAELMRFQYNFVTSVKFSADGSRLAISCGVTPRLIDCPLESRPSSEVEKLLLNLLPTSPTG